VANGTLRACQSFQSVGTRYPVNRVNASSMPTEKAKDVDFAFAGETIALKVVADLCLQYCELCLHAAQRRGRLYSYVLSRLVICGVIVARLQQAFPCPRLPPPLGQASAGHRRVG
jgi:hypothetical protein